MGVWADEPRALPWAGMNDALGVSAPPPCPTTLIIFAPEESSPAPSPDGRIQAQNCSRRRQVVLPKSCVYLRGRARSPSGQPWDVETRAFPTFLYAHGPLAERALPIKPLSENVMCASPATRVNDVTEAIPILYAINVRTPPDQYRTNTGPPRESRRTLAGHTRDPHRR